MKFIYADAMDFVDPEFDFKNERNTEGRIVQWDDEYPHEFLDRAPYDGILVSRGVVGDARGRGASCAIAKLSIRTVFCSAIVVRSLTATKSCRRIRRQTRSSSMRTEASLTAVRWITSSLTSMMARVGYERTCLKKPLIATM
jgi:hypothetical protein